MTVFPIPDDTLFLLKDGNGIFERFSGSEKGIFESTGGRDVYIDGGNLDGIQFKVVAPSTLDLCAGNLVVDATQESGNPHLSFSYYWRIVYQPTETPIGSQVFTGSQNFVRFPVTNLVSDIGTLQLPNFETYDLVAEVYIYDSVFGILLAHHVSPIISFSTESTKIPITIEGVGANDVIARVSTEQLNFRVFIDEVSGNCSLGATGSSSNGGYSYNYVWSVYFVILLFF